MLSKFLFAIRPRPQSVDAANLKSQEQGRLSRRGLQRIFGRNITWLSDRDGLPDGHVPIGINADTGSYQTIPMQHLQESTQSSEVGEHDFLTSGSVSLPGEGQQTLELQQKIDTSTRLAAQYWSSRGTAHATSSLPQEPDTGGAGVSATDPDSWLSSSVDEDYVLINSPQDTVAAETSPTQTSSTPPSPVPSLPETGRTRQWDVLLNGMLRRKSDPGPSKPSSPKANKQKPRALRSLKPNQAKSVEPTVVTRQERQRTCSSLDKTLEGLEKRLKAYSTSNAEVEASELKARFGDPADDLRFQISDAVESGHLDPTDAQFLLDRLHFAYGKAVDLTGRSAHANYYSQRQDAVDDQRYYGGVVDPNYSGTVLWRRGKPPSVSEATRAEEQFSRADRSQIQIELAQTQQELVKTLRELQEAGPDKAGSRIDSALLRPLREFLEEAEAAHKNRYISTAQLHNYARFALQTAKQAPDLVPRNWASGGLGRGVIDYANELLGNA